MYRLAAFDMDGTLLMPDHRAEWFRDASVIRELGSYL